MISLRFGGTPENKWLRDTDLKETIRFVKFEVFEANRFEHTEISLGSKVQMTCGITTVCFFKPLLVKHVVNDKELENICFSVSKMEKV
jgi:hypothetical protein